METYSPTTEDYIQSLTLYIESNIVSDWLKSEPIRLGNHMLPYKFKHCEFFRLNQTIRILYSVIGDYGPVSFIYRLNPLPNKPYFLRVCSTSLLRTLWKKEKLLITYSFSFSHSVFYLFGELSAIFIKFKIAVWIDFEFGRVYNLLYEKGLKCLLGLSV